jgi:hypothetical protein
VHWIHDYSGCSRQVSRKGLGLVCFLACLFVCLLSSYMLLIQDAVGRNVCGDTVRQLLLLSTLPDFCSLCSTSLEARLHTDFCVTHCFSSCSSSSASSPSSPSSPSYSCFLAHSHYSSLNSHNFFFFFLIIYSTAPRLTRGFTPTSGCIWSTSRRRLQAGSEMCLATRTGENCV